MLHRLIILAITIFVAYFSLWTALCGLGCRPGRYGNTDDTPGVIRLPSSGTIGGPNSCRSFGSETSGSNIGVLKASSSNRDGPSVSVTSTSGTPSIPLITEKVQKPDASSSETVVVKCRKCGRDRPSDPDSGPTDSGGTSSGPNGDPHKGPVSAPSSGRNGNSGPSGGTSSDPHKNGNVVPVSFKQGKRARCTCEACPCALIEEYVLPVAQVGMDTVDITSECFNDFTDWFLQRLGVFVSQSRAAGPRQAEIIHSRTTMYHESVEELRLVENPGFQKQTVSINPSATVFLEPSVHSSTQNVIKLVKRISETVTGQKTSEPSVRIPKEGSNQEVSEKVSDLSAQKTEKAPNIPPLETEATSEITAKQIKETPDKAVKISEKAPDISTQETEKALNIPLLETEATSEITNKQIKETSDKAVKISEKAPDISTQKTKEAPDVSTQKPEKAPDVSTQEIKATSEIIVKKTEDTTDLIAQKSDNVSTVKETQTASNPPNKNSELASATTSSAVENKMLMSPPKQSSKLDLDARDGSKIIKPSGNDETDNPERNCSECARKGHVCMGKCPTAQKKIQRQQSKE